METVKRLLGDEFQTLKHEIEVHCGRDSAHPSEDPKKLQVSESHEQENKPEPSSSTIHVDSGLQHADLSSGRPHYYFGSELFCSSTLD
jgi:hypothetical protein